MPISVRTSALLLALSACNQGGDAAHTPTPVPRSPETPTPSAVPPPASAGPAASAAPEHGGVPKDLNVLVITIDSLRADMPWAGYERDIAPALTAFEKTAVSYSRAYSISSYTSMSLGGFLGGRYPSELERSGYFFGNYPDSVTMFPELLQKAGVRTISAHAHFYFDQKAGFRQGFDVYEIVPGLSADNTTDKNVTSPQHLEIAQRLLSDKANSDKRFFAWFHFLDPHDVYMRHEGIDFGKSARDLYDGEVAFTDRHVGKLLSWVDQTEWGKRTAVIVSADHGEAFGEHKMYRHGFEVWDVLVHVPLMIRAPGIQPRKIDVLRSAIDLPPTILELLGAPAEPSMSGKSLVPELYGAAPEERDVLVDLPRTSDNDRRRALLHDKWKLIVYGDDFGFDLFDLSTDPGETKDLKRDQKDAFEMMKARYKEKASTVKDVCPKNTHKLRGKAKGSPC